MVLLVGETLDTPIWNVAMVHPNKKQANENNS